MLHTCVIAENIADLILCENRHCI